jgi:hypothetical protein
VSDQSHLVAIRMFFATSSFRPEFTFYAGCEQVGELPHNKSI